MPAEAFLRFDCADVFTAEECARLRQGLVPEAMEDKWIVSFEDPFLLFHRSWTRELVYRLRLEAHGEGGRISEAEVSRSVGLMYGPAYEGALVSFLLRGLVLQQAVSFPVPPAGAPGPPGLYQHAVSGTGFPENTYEAPRPAGIGSALARGWRWLTSRGR